MLVLPDEPSAFFSNSGLATRDMLMITQEQLKEILHYDQETGVFTWKEMPDVFPGCKHVKRWNTRYCGVVAGSKLTLSFRYIRIRIVGRDHLAHRLAWLYVYGKWPEKHIDHINGNGLDNRIVNLRDVDIKENGKN